MSIQKDLEHLKKTIIDYNYRMSPTAEKEKIQEYCLIAADFDKRILEKLEIPISTLKYTTEKYDRIIEDSKFTISLLEKSLGIEYKTSYEASWPYKDSMLVDGILFTVKNEIVLNSHPEYTDTKIAEKAQKLVENGTAKADKKLAKLFKKHDGLEDHVNYKKIVKKIDYYKEQQEKIYNKNNEALRELEVSKNNVNDLINYAYKMKEVKQNIEAASFFLKHYKELSLDFAGAVGSFYEQTGLTNKDINIKEEVFKVQTATILHDALRQPGFDDGTKSYKPRWRNIGNAEYSPNESAVTREKDGVMEVDVANTAFCDLPFKWQLEVYQAAEVAMYISKEATEEHEVEKHGPNNHEYWLSNNDYAKEGAMGESFVNLPAEQKNKNLKQYVDAFKQAVEAIETLEIPFNETQAKHFDY